MIASCLKTFLKLRFHYGRQVSSVSLANTARAVVGILWREIETGYVTTWGMYESERQMERDRENSHRRQSTAEN